MAQLRVVGAQWTDDNKIKTGHVVFYATQTWPHARAGATAARPFLVPRILTGRPSARPGVA